MRPTALPFLFFLALSLSACRPDAPAPDPAPKPVSSRWAEVEALVKAGDYVAAYSALEAQRLAGQPDPELLLRLAEVRRLQGEPVKAILLLREGLVVAPEAKNLITPLAGLYLQLGDLGAARDLLDKARAAGIQSPELSLLHGQAMGRLEKPTEALKSFEEALALGAKAAVVDYNRALVLGELGRHAEAVQALEGVVAAEPQWAAAKRELARAILDGVPTDSATINRALDLLVDLQAELPEDWRLHESIGDAWLLLGDFDAALAAYTEALRHGQNPKSVEDRYRVAALKKMERDGGGEAPPVPR